MKRILVIGATGITGRAAVAQLIARNMRVRALTRNADAANLPARAEIASGDLTMPDTLDGCLEGVDAVFLVWSAPAAAAAPALERIAKRAPRVVFLSAPYRTAHPFFQANPRMTLHADIERLIEGSGLEWTFVRPGMFAANARVWWAATMRAGDVVRWPYG
jgi:uncharacterized protein YbjT (DUF2867 family)